MNFQKLILITLIILLSLSVGYLKDDKKKRLIAIVCLGIVLAFYVAVTQPAIFSRSIV